ncbi:DUF3541 domain-containing protein [Shewanella inventionis]|uniref:DUF3541 domain-containing protein n=1 Tax=Shewanella inventionis TaxID=1738770 RepID=A0ABQ1IRP9_9GAMM|nr:DUF3541 domain-containing protein [Shewanella inventionis]MCL1157223.1 DUF3541 domain-containing protein [Shewanella inventionis]GGB48910.1 hypothetical protein GCM10011607_06570 [Shewanella inventionis]
MLQLHKSNTLSLLLLSASLLSSVAIAKEAVEKHSHNLTAEQVYQGIKTNLESNLYSLPPRVQGHYAIRQYRMTGENKYANGSLIDLLTIAEQQAYYYCNIDKPGFIKTESQKEVAKIKPGIRGDARKLALAPYPEFMFYSDILLRFGSRVDEFGFTGPCHDLMLNTLKNVDLQPALTDKNMIKAWAAQLINYVFWAKQLGVGDYYSAYKKAFIQTYPDNEDNKLNKSQYKNKIYGMTHFIFAASQYYQYPVDAKEYQWILNYFEKNIDRILVDTTEDIITEVGISFLITGNQDNPVVNKVKKHIIAAYNPKFNMIPSPKGEAILSSGEHRNVLAMMLLDWPDTLHKGPLLGEISSTKRYLPKLVTPKAAAKDSKSH